MTVKELIDMLGEADPMAVVKIYDADAEDLMPVTGCVHDPNEVELLSDGMEG